jgi:hypothetical protein
VVRSRLSNRASVSSQRGGPSGSGITYEGRPVPFVEPTLWLDHSLNRDDVPDHNDDEETSWAEGPVGQ